MNTLFRFLRARRPIAMTEGPGDFLERHARSDPVGASSYGRNSEDGPRPTQALGPAAWQQAEPVVEALEAILARARATLDLDPEQLRTWVDVALGDTDGSFRSLLTEMHAAAAGREPGSAHHTAEAIRLLSAYDAAGHNDASDPAAEWRWMLDAPVPASRRGRRRIRSMTLVPDRDQGVNAAPPVAERSPSLLERYREVVQTLADPGQLGVNAAPPAAERSPSLLQRYGQVFAALAGRGRLGAVEQPSDLSAIAHARAALRQEAAALWTSTQARTPRRRWLLRNGSVVPLSSAASPTAAPGSAAAPLTGSDYVRFAGVADVYRVEERTAQYQLGDIAHIENVLPGESFERVHERASEREEDPPRRGDSVHH